jgi:SpoVK/Ycf46/Vps4 family AAA+-type ATPase
LYLARRPIDDAVDLDALAQHLEGFSGADIKYIADRAATIPFLQSVATGKEGRITAQILQDVIADTRRSVTAEMLARFQQWSAAAERS